MVYYYIAHIQTSTMNITIWIIEHIEHKCSIQITHKYHHMTAISVQLQIYSHREVADFTSLERPEWDSNQCSQSLVISDLDHYATSIIACDCFVHLFLINKCTTIRL